MYSFTYISLTIIRFTLLTEVFIFYPVALLVSHSGGFILFLHPAGRFGGAVKNRRVFQLKATLHILKLQTIYMAKYTMVQLWLYTIYLGTKKDKISYYPCENLNEYAGFHTEGRRGTGIPTPPPPPPPPPPKKKKK